MQPRPSLCLIPALLLTAPAPQAVAREPLRGPDLSAVANLPRAYHPALHAAIRAFVRERNPNPGCFTVTARYLGQSLAVTFTPGRPLPSDRHLGGGRTSCGRDVTFLVARNGTLIRRTYSR
ncbi:MAG TPA: hypothetical protein VMG08_12605 [Allosphingosinicella sp.]|nr:hypothetical protein [Allosphingosinicella sp.]